MNRRIIGSCLALGFVFCFAGSAFADRVPSTRTGGQKSSGSRIDQTVPYLTSRKGRMLSRVSEQALPRRSRVLSNRERQDGSGG